MSSGRCDSLWQVMLRSSEMGYHQELWAALNVEADWMSVVVCCSGKAEC